MERHRISIEVVRAVLKQHAVVDVRNEARIREHVRETAALVQLRVVGSHQHPVFVDFDALHSPDEKRDCDENVVVGHRHYDAIRKRQRSYKIEVNPCR